MESDAIVYCENQLGKLDGKVTNGLIRRSAKYEILGVIDSTKAGMDTGEYLDGIKNGIPVFLDIDDALESLDRVPEYFIYGIAPLELFLPTGEREVIFQAMKRGLNIVNGLPEYFNDDEEFLRIARESGVRIHDVRKPPPRKDLHTFTGRIYEVDIPVITVLGTDCAVGKRTTSILLVDALREKGVNAAFVATGQTGLIQGAKYGVAVDVLSSAFMTGEIENAVVDAYETEHPDIIIVEGQGALGHPTFTSTCAIIKGSMPNAIIVQHPPKRKTRCDFPRIPMPTLESEIELLEIFSRSRVIAISINHEDMVDGELEEIIAEYETRYRLPTTDPLKYGCGKFISRLLEVFPEIVDN